MKNPTITVVIALLHVGSIYAQAVQTNAPAQFKNTLTNLLPGQSAVPLIRAIAAPKFVPAEPSNSVTSNGPAGPDLGIGASSAVPQEIRLLNDGAIADYGLQKVLFPAEITEAPIVIITPDSRRLAVHATFLALHDVASGQSLLLGEVKQSIGELVGDNTILYPMAFDTISASIRYRYTKNSLEQDILLHEMVNVPKEFQAENLRLEVWSEWIDSTPDSKETQTIDLRPLAATGGQVAVAATDEHLKFGAMRIGDGYAFAIQNEGEKTPVGKTFARIEGRDWLIERVDYTALKPKLDKLPKSQASLDPDNIKSDHARLVRSLHARTAPKPSGKSAPMRMAKAETVAKDSVVLDFIIISSVPVPANSISWWPGGGNGLDAISTNHAVWVGTSDYNVGKVGQSFSFDGSNYLRVTNSSNLGPTNGITVEGWVWLASGTSDFRSIAIKGSAASDWSYWLLLNDYDNTLYALVEASVFISSTTSLTSEAWHHVAMTYDASSDILSLYVDGQFESDGLIPDGLAPLPDHLLIGEGGSGYYPFLGKIDELSLYSRALSASEIQTIYNAGAAGKNNPNCLTAPTNIVAWWPGDGNGYDLARTNFATLSGATYESAVVGEGFSFDGVDDGVTAANDDALNLATTNDNVTIEAWIKPLDNPTSYGVMSIAGKRDATAPTPTGYELYLVSGAPGFQIANGSAYANFTGTGDLRDGGYHHIAVTLDRSSTNGGKIYVDGTSILTFNPTVLPGSLGNSAPVRIGVHPSSPNGMYKGTIDEVSFYRRALSSIEITALYSAGSAGKCKTDPDGDGLTDLQESFLGTNPNDIDSDDDGLTDGDEVFIYLTDPNNQDSDGDGVIDQPFKVYITRPN